MMDFFFLVSLLGKLKTFATLVRFLFPLTVQWSAGLTPLVCQTDLDVLGSWVFLTIHSFCLECPPTGLVATHCPSRPDLPS